MKVTVRFANGKERIVTVQDHQILQAALGAVEDEDRAARETEKANRGAAQIVAIE